MIVMTPKHKKRLGMVVLLVIGISAATVLALTAFRENMLFFYSPSQIINGEAPADRVIRLGGLVTPGSIQRATDSLKINFVVTDTAHSIAVQYTGILPDLFREGQGIVAIGKMHADNIFVADEVLAKHDENYMPPEVASSLKKAQQPSPNP